VNEESIDTSVVSLCVAGRVGTRHSERSEESREWSENKESIKD